MDEELAEQYHHVAAQSGHAQSMHELGTIHYLGDGPSDSEEAVRWFRKAARLGVCGSMYMLGECLLNGDGTQQNADAALGWFAAAADLGHRGARHQVLTHYLWPPVNAHYLAPDNEASTEWKMYQRYKFAARGGLGRSSGVCRVKADIT